MPYFRNHAIQMRIIRTNPKQETATTPESDFGDRVITMTAAAEIVLKKVAMAALAYVAVDTLRQIAVAKATNPR